MRYEYDAILHEIPENGGAYVDCPWDKGINANRRSANQRRAPVGVSLNSWIILRSRSESPPRQRLPCLGRRLCRCSR